MIVQTLHAFAVGVGFSIGVLVGAVLCQVATKSSQKRFNENWQKNQDVIEQRLARSMVAHERTAIAMEKLATVVDARMKTL